METTQVHFTIDFDWLTGFIRDLWSEGDYEHAYRVLDSSGLPELRWADLLAGKIRFSQAPGGIEGCEAIAVPDTWEPILDHCHLCIYPNPYKGLMNALSEGLRAKEKREAEWKERIESDNQKVVQYESLQATEEGKEKSRQDRLGTRLESLTDGLVRQQLETLRVSDRFYDFHKENGLFPDVEFNYLYGFITPEGVFYGCPYFAHNALLELLGKADDYQDCPNGWIKISRSLAEKHPIVIKKGAKKPNKKQIDTLYAWAEKHEQPMSEILQYLFLED